MACGRCSAAELDNPVVTARDARDVALCPTGALQEIGASVDAGALVETLLQDRIFFDDSGGGVTLSGGEPLLQAPFVTEVLSRLRAEGVHTALDTSGFCGWTDLRDAAAQACVVLYDLKLFDRARHEAATGVSNERILGNLRALSAVHDHIWIRIPIVPGVNDDEGNMAATAEFLRPLAGIRRVDLLAYHAIGEAKFARAGLPYVLHGTPTPTAAQLETVATPLRAAGLHTTIGGGA